MTNPKPIGQINGPFSLLFKFVMLTYPVALTAAIAWGTWVTRQQMTDNAFRNYGPRVSQKDLALVRAEIVEWQRLHDSEQRQWERGHESSHASLPPQDWRIRILAVEQNVESNSLKLERIIAILEREPQ